MSESLDEVILAVIAKEPGIHNKELRRLVGAPPRTISKRIKALSTDKYITVHRISTSTTRYYIMDDERDTMINEFMTDLNRVTESVYKQFMSAPTPVQEAMLSECKRTLSTLQEQADSLYKDKSLLSGVDARAEKFAEQCTKLEETARKYLTNLNLVDSVTTYAERAASLFHAVAAERDRINSNKGDMHDNRRYDAGEAIADLDNIMRSLPSHVAEMIDVIAQLEHDIPPKYPRAHKDVMDLLKGAEKNLKKIRKSLDVLLTTMATPGTGREVNTFSDEDLGEFMKAVAMMTDKKDLDTFDNDEYAALMACAICVHEGRDPSDLGEDEYATLLEYVDGHRTESIDNSFDDKRSASMSTDASHDKFLSALEDFEPNSENDDLIDNPLVRMGEYVEYLQQILDQVHLVTVASVMEYQLTVCFDRVQDLLEEYKLTYVVIKKMEW